MADLIVNEITPEFDTFFQGCYDLIKEDIKRFKNLTAPDFQFKMGRRYIKLIKIDNQQTVYAFVDRTNGDVLKPAGWKAPAKHARGNIFDKWNGLKTMSAYGPAYLK